MKKHENIVLIGMPSAGKSTLGVLLAKVLKKDFMDADLVIQQKYKKSLQEIINEEGLNDFLAIESQVIKSIKLNEHILATGGSVVYCDKAMASLKSQDAIIIYLELPLEEVKRRLTNMKTRGIAMVEGQTLESLFKERQGLYEKYADIKIKCDGFTIEESVERIVKEINNY